MKIVTIYDGTLHAKKALHYGIHRVQESGGELVLLQVFDRSAFIDYDAGPGAVQMAKAEMAVHLDWAKRHLEEHAAGLRVRMITEEGDTIARALHHAEAEHADLLLAPPKYQAVRMSAACPVRVIPGPILVPLDNTGSPAAGSEDVVRDAMLTGSPVLLLGVVPVHLYSRGEKQELEAVRKATSASVRRMKELLAGRGIEVRDSIRSGYPDEEILKAAEEFNVSLIMLPAGGITPSELTKASVILLEEAPRQHWVISLLPAESAA
jgi:nucleotide-binding universal stress UspA family protein